MAKYIVIERPNGVVTIVRSEIETGSEEPLTEHEQIINELYSKVKKLDLTPVSNLLCGSFELDNKTSSATKCKCGREKWEHPKAT